MPDKEKRAQAIVDQVHRAGGTAVKAIRDVFRELHDKSLAARAAREKYSASEIGRALLKIWPDPGIPVPYTYDCCW